MKSKCEICGKEIVGQSAKKLMHGSNGYRLYDVCLKHVQDVSAPADFGARVEKGMGKRAHRNGVSSRTLKKLTDHVEAL